MRLSITQLDGTEADRIVYVSSDQESKLAEIENRLADVLKDSPQLAFAATTRVLWKALSQESHNE
jgi:predicted phage-related endonuclease